MQRAVGCASAWLDDRTWPRARSALWKPLFDNLRCDHVRTTEGGELVARLDADPARRRTLELLGQSARVYRAAAARTTWRGSIERDVLTQGILPLLADDDLDRRLRAAATAIGATERVASHLQRAFDTLLWALTRRHGSAPRAQLIADTEKVLEETREGLAKAVVAERLAIAGLRSFPESTFEVIALPLDALADAAADGLSSPSALLDAVLSRHAVVQKAKGKPRWIDDGAPMTLMPGFGLNSESAPQLQDSYQHPFRIVNAITFLRDLGRVDVGDADGEA
jgi:hypothetical protein